MGAELKCIFSTGTGKLVTIPIPGKTVLIEGKPAATIMDFVPMTNILPMMMCIAPTNPQGMGKPPPAVPTPTACIPIVTAPWKPPVAPTKQVNNKSILAVGSTCQCVWQGIITVMNPGTTKTQVQ